MTYQQSPECRSDYQAVQDALDLVGGKWKLVILTTLLERKRRFKELAREIGISPRILSKELQALELNRLVNRTVFDTCPITVEYAVTAHGQTLIPVITALKEWGLAHRKAIFSEASLAIPAA